MEVGEIYGNLKIIEVGLKDNWTHAACIYECLNCGRLKKTTEYTIKTGTTKGCSFCRKEKQRKGSILPLFEDTQKAYYYHGLIYSDGSIYDSNGYKMSCLSIQMVENDRDEMVKFADFIGCQAKFHKKKDGRDQWRVRVTDYVRLPELANKLDIHDNKTYNPPNPTLFDNMTVEQRLSICAGFIDGDGHRKKERNCFNVIVHSSWMETLKSLFRDVIYSSSYNINGYARITVATKGFFILKNHIEKYNLPVMSRKWYDLAVGVK